MRGTVPKQKHACKMLHGGAKAGVVVLQFYIHNPRPAFSSQDQGKGASRSSLRNCEKKEKQECWYKSWYKKRKKRHLWPILTGEQGRESPGVWFWVGLRFFGCLFFLNTNSKDQIKAGVQGQKCLLFVFKIIFVDTIHICPIISKSYYLY